MSKQNNNYEADRGTKKVDTGKILFFAVIAALIVLITLLCVGSYRAKHNPSGTKPASSTSAVPETSTTEVSTTYRAMVVSNGDTDKAVMKNGKWALPHEDGLVDEERVGVYRIIIPAVSSKPDYYYFDGGVWQPKYNGIHYQGDDPLVIHNGKWDPHFTGFMAYNHYLRYTVNGIYQQDFNGKIYFGEGDDKVARQCRDGAVLGEELDRDDGFIYPVHDWSLTP